MESFNVSIVGNCTVSRFYASVQPQLGKQTSFDACDTRAMQQIAFYRGESGTCSYDPVSAPSTATDPLYAEYLDVNAQCQNFFRSFVCEYRPDFPTSIYPDITPYFVADLALSQLVSEQTLVPPASSSAQALLTEDRPTLGLLGLVLPLLVAFVQGLIA